MSQDPTAPTEQPPQGNPAEPQQGAPQVEPTATPPPPEPSVQELQQALAQREQALNQQQEQYRHLQADYTRKAQALAHLTGGGVLQPAAPPDPLAQDIHYWTEQGYNPKDARAMAQYVNGKIAPIQQQLSQQLQSVQYAGQVDVTLRDAWGKYPQVFSDPAVSNRVDQELRYFASQGGQPTEQMALQIAFIAKGEADLARAAQPNAAPPVQPNFMANGTWGPRPGYAQPAPTKPQPVQFAPEVMAFEADLQARMAKNKPR